MARLRNNVFSGSSISDVDPDQLTYKRVAANAIGDTALIEDIVTGDHTPPTNSTINHGGLVGSLYRGCPLGVPLIQRVWPRAGGFGGGPKVSCSNAGDFLGPNVMMPYAPNNISDSVLTALIVACSPNGHNITGMTVEVKLVGPSSPTTSARSRPAWGLAAPAVQRMTIGRFSSTSVTTKPPYAPYAA